MMMFAIVLPLHFALLVMGHVCLSCFSLFLFYLSVVLQTQSAFIARIQFPARLENARTGFTLALVTCGPIFLGAFVVVNKQMQTKRTAAPKLLDCVSVCVWPCGRD